VMPHPTGSLSLSLIDLSPVVPPATSMVERVYGSLKHQILTCKLQPGRRLNEKELCEEFSISRTPLREALSRLAMDQLVQTGHYRGYQVSPILVADVIELCEVRIIVEGSMGALAAERASPEEIEQLASLAELPYEPGNRTTYEDYLRANSAFHKALAKCSRNRRLEGIVMSVLDQLQRPIYLGLDVGLDPAAATAEHVDIVQAIRNRDCAKASFILTRNIGATRDRIVAVLEEPSPPPKK
jgi:DNA-binding GntR family transcriptional regulator